MAWKISSGQSRCSRNFSSFIENHAMNRNTSFSRRDFLRTASAATLSALAAGYPDQDERSPPPQLLPSALREGLVRHHQTASRAASSCDLSRTLETPLWRSVVEGDLGFRNSDSCVLPAVHVPVRPERHAVANQVTSEDVLPPTRRTDPRRSLLATRLQP